MDSSKKRPETLRFLGYILMETQHDHPHRAYRISDVEDALVWTSPENRQILCPFDSVWSRNLAQEIVRELRNQP